MSVETKKIISFPDDYNEYHGSNDKGYYNVYVDDGKIIKCPDYYRKFSESIAEMYSEGADMENKHDEFGYPSQETIDELYEIANKTGSYVEKLREIAIDSLAENLVREYDIIEITNTGIKEMLDSEFGEMFKNVTSQGVFIVKLEENVKKYNKTLILH